MKRALIVSFCIMITLALSAQNQEQTPQNTPGEINDPTSNDKTRQPSDVETIEILQASILRKAELIQSLYFIEEETPQTYGAYASGGDIVTRHVKKKIYSAGQTLLDHHNSNLSNAKSEDKKIAELREIIRINDRLIQLGQIENTRAKEKELKKLKDVNAIRPVFFAD